VETLAQPAVTPTTSESTSAATTQPGRIIQPAAATVRAEMDRVRSSMTNILAKAEAEVNCGTIPLISWGFARSRIGLVKRLLLAARVVDPYT
jgi:hypothetical protein